MSIIRKEAYFNSSNGLNKIRTLIWEDDELTPIGIVQMAHGMAEHIARYDEFARFLASNGFVVCGNDHLGHGKSIEDRYQIGFMGERDGDKRLVDDMHILTKIMKKRNPDIPYFLFGHSMGSFCARIYSVLFGYELDGVILCGTGDMPDLINAGVDLIEMLINKLGMMKRYDKAAEMVNKGFSMMGPEKDSTLAWLSENKENRLNYSNDELCGFTYTLAGYRDVYNIIRTATDSDWALRMPKDLPIMIVSGADDPVGMNGKGVLAVADSLAGEGIEPTTILYPGMRHEILNETDRDVVYKDILSFLLSIYTKEVSFWQNLYQTNRLNYKRILQLK